MPSKPDFTRHATFIRQSRASLARAFAVGAGIVALLATGSWAATKTIAPTKTPAAVPSRAGVRMTVGMAPATVAPRTKNPHLHVAATTQHKHHKSKSHHSWQSRWSYYAWSGSHRGLGMVQGVVHDKHGQPVPFAMVELKHKNGHSFQHASMRHTVRANAAGQFVMMRVRSGKYRIASIRGKSHGHSMVTVHTNAMSPARIKI
jgi:hypothetical protein